MTEPKKAPVKRAPRKVTPKPAPEVVIEEALEDEQLYIRNRGGVRIRIRAQRKKNESYDYSLAPRGERGDAEPIDAEDLAFLLNNAENAGLYEIITHSQAQAYMGKQTHNQQKFHPALAALKDEFGNPIRGIAHQRVSTATVSPSSTVTMPEGDLDRLNEFPPGRPE